ncbi:MAG: hypothetical protein Q8878_04220 [Bacillota bacterium]|nr:hypothetical protein [Bacillota bacterium]
MKRTIIATLILSLIVVLAACGNATAKVSGSAQISNTTAESSSAESSSAESSSAESSSAESKNATVKTFDISESELSASMSKAFEKSEYVNAFASDPTIKESESKYYGKTVDYVYQVCNGVQCILTETKNDHKVLSVFLYGDSSKMAKSDAKTFGGYAAKIIGGFENDENTLSSIDTKLDIPNIGFSTDVVNIASGTLASFTYIVDKGTAMLQISPL